MTASSELRDQLQAALGAAYAIEGELGGGGMSRVFAATETSLGRQVVIKVLPPEMAEGVSVDRFKREIALAARLQHPHIVPLLAAADAAGVPYYTMPLVDGDSLRARLSKGPLPIADVISVLRDVAKALAYAHERGVVHRDIKPDNVLLTGGSAVVTDFGVAKALSAAKGLLSGSTLTQVGSSLGTPAYMAPEQAAADPTMDHRADIYAFGVMAYEMLAGRPPFHGRTPQKLLAAQMGETPEAIGEIRPDTPPLLAHLIMRCLEKDPVDRPQSAADLTRVLETVTSGGGLPAMPTILLGGRRRVWRVLSYYAAAVLAVALVAWAATVVIGLPGWVFPGALVVMGLGLPVILFTAFVHHGTYQAMTQGTLTPGGTPTARSTMTRLAVKASPWVSWRRTAIGGVVAVAAFAVLVLGFMVARAFGIGPAGSLLAAGRLKNQERLLVTDFRARGADTSLGPVVTEAVRTDLGQSAVVSVVPTTVVSTALTRMRRPDTTRVDLGLGREIAAREGIKAVVDGDIQSLAGGYLITIRLVAAESGDELASYHEAIDSPKQLIPAVDALTRELRAKIGESLKAVRAAPPLEQVTTTSLEALRKYAAGARANDVEAQFPKAEALLQQAVALDTTFAMAYRKLGVALRNDGMPATRVDSAIGQAYRFRDHLSERERDLATATYFDFGSGRDRQRAGAAYERLLARDSLDGVANINLAIISWRRRDFPRAEMLVRRALSSQPGSANGLFTLGVIQLDAGKLAAAESALAEVRQAVPGAPVNSVLGAMALYSRGRVDSLGAFLKDVRATATDPGLRAAATAAQAAISTLRGRLSEAGRLYAEAAAQQAARGAPEYPLTVGLRLATSDIWFREQHARGAHFLDSILTGGVPAAGRDTMSPHLAAAQLYALAERSDRARALLGRYQVDVKDSGLIRGDEPERHNTVGEIALAEHRPLEALAEFRRGDRLPDGPATPCGWCLVARLGRAYDAANVADSAIWAYEQYVSAPGAGKLFTDALYLAGIHKRLGELYQAKGDREKAATHYLQFVELWKNADPELQPRVAEVKQRLARLRRTKGT